MSEELVDEILTRLDRAGELAGDGFEVLIRQVYLSVVTDVLWMIFLGVITAFFVITIRRCGYMGGEHRWHVNKGPYNESRELAVIGSSIGLLLSTGVMFALLMAVIRKLINPEFYAIRYIFQAVS